MTCYIIAEAGVNHNGSEELALALVDVAVDAGVDAVKFQTFKAETLVKKGAEKATYQKKQTGSGDQFEMLQKLELSDEAHMRLAAYCAEKNVEFLSTGFDEPAIDMLIGLGMRRLKVPSGELTNKPYIDYIASKNLPIILSTGMATLDEVEEAIDWIKDCRKRLGFEEILPNVLSILHCTSNYPTPLEGVNLRAMKTMKKAFSLPVGYSDHTAGILVSPIAVAMGATVIEKHFTLEKTMDGPDHQASLEPSELKQMVKDIRAVELSLGNGVKVPTAEELRVREVVRRSIVLARDIQMGQAITEADVVLLRPSGGIPPKEIGQLLGREVVRHLKAGHQLHWDDLKA